MILGVVSNCWREQLAQGVSLQLLVEKAQREGYRAVELRQGCLGEFETATEHVPLASPLIKLPVKFPNIRFNIALAFPFFDAASDRSSPLMEMGLISAERLAGKFQPHLRLVDVSTEKSQIHPQDLQTIINNVVELARAIIDRDGMLSLENGKQEWSLLRNAINRARVELMSDASRLLHCYDPCNLLNAADKPDANDITESLPATDLAMVHFKQARGGEIQPTVCDGDIDWQHQLNCLQRAGFDGPALFELPPHERIWDHLRESRDYLEGLGLKLN